MCVIVIYLLFVKKWWNCGWRWDNNNTIQRFLAYIVFSFFNKYQIYYQNYLLSMNFFFIHIHLSLRLSEWFEFGQGALTITNPFKNQKYFISYSIKGIFTRKIIQLYQAKFVSLWYSKFYLSIWGGNVSVHSFYIFRPSLHTMLKQLTQQFWKLV